MRYARKVYECPQSYNDKEGWHYTKSFKEAEEEMLNYIKNVMKVDFPYPENYYYQMVNTIAKEKGKPLTYIEKLEKSNRELKEAIKEQKEIIECLKKQIFDLTGCIVLEDLE